MINRGGGKTAGERVPVGDPLGGQEGNSKARFLRGEVNSAVDQPKGCEELLRRYFKNPKAGWTGDPGVSNNFLFYSRLILLKIIILFEIYFYSRLLFLFKIILFKIIIISRLFFYEI